MDVPTVDLPALPRLLAAPEPGWVETTDVIVVGSGVAGLTAALHLREAGLHVTVVTKVNIDDGSTRWAQGGIAAVLDPTDTPAAHARDTEIAGVGLCDPAAVRVLVEEGPTRLRELMRIGAEFDRHPDGSLMLTREVGTARTGSCTRAGTPPAPRCSGPCTPLCSATRGSGWSSTPWCWTCCGRPATAQTGSVRPAGSPCTCSVRAARTASARCWPGRWCWPPAGWARSSRPPPTRRSPPATGWRWRCGPARR